MKDFLLQDPLHEILERHLFRSATEDETAAQLINTVIADYLMFLDSQNVHIPINCREALVEDLREEIRELIVKKTHGSVPVPTEVATRAPYQRRSSRKII